MIILVDQDDVLADFDAHFADLWRAQYPTEFFLPPEKRTRFYLSEEYPARLKPQVTGIYTQPGFFRNLPPMPGGVEAVQQMVALGHTVRICTAPIEEYEHCVTEKFQWVEQHLGRAFTKNIILTSDKTFVRGDMIIDDKPEIRGACTPVWEHVLFDRPYNRAVTGQRRVDWTNWRAVLGL